MTLAYRGVDQIAESRFRAVRERLSAGLEGMDALVRVAACRQARIVGGGVAIALGVLGFLLAFAPLPERGNWLIGSGSGAATIVFVCAWPVALLVAWLTGAVSRETLQMRLSTPLEPTGDAFADLARIERLDPVPALERTARERERLSVALPLAGVALLAPLTIHFLVSLCIVSATGEGETAAQFDDWIRWSALLVGHAHIVLVLCAFRFARRLGSRDTASIAARGTARDGAGAAGWATLASLVPGAVLFMIPPALVLVTGLAFAPLAFSLLGRRVLAERRALDRVVAAEPA